MEPPPRPPRPPGRFSPTPSTPTGPIFLPAANVAHNRSESGESSDSASSPYGKQTSQGYQNAGASSQQPPSRSQYPPRIPGMSTPISSSTQSPGGGSMGSGGSPNTSPNHRASNPSPGTWRDTGSKSGAFTTSPTGGKMGMAFSNASASSLHNFSRPSIAQVVNEREGAARRNSPLNPGATPNDPRSHKRNNSQGFFEPSLPTASLGATGERSASGTLSPSHIAAQAAMQNQQLQQNHQSPHLANNPHVRKRSQTIPAPQGDPIPMPTPSSNRSRPPTMPAAPANAQRLNTGSPSSTGLPMPQYAQASTNSPTATATIAAGAAFPGRGGQLSPGMTSFLDQEREVRDTREAKPKEKSERSKMKLFSKPRTIGITGYREGKDKPLPSPGKAPSIYSKSSVNASTTSLGEVGPPPSLYSVANSSTSTLVPLERQKEKEEKGHRHHLFTRQKKYKDRPDEHALTLSSAASNSKPIDPSAPQSIYNFAPPSPGLAQGTFAKSVSGFDLRHGGRALREKKREEKAAANALESRRGEEGLGIGVSGFGPASNTSTGYALPSGVDSGHLQGFGISNMTPDDAWDFLKAKLLIVFEGEELRMPIEDLNRLVSIHVKRCVMSKEPSTIIEDLSEFLTTGFLSLEQTLRGVPEGQLVRAIVDMWLFVFGVVLPYMQTVFLPLDLEFRGHGPIMSLTEAAEFWGRDLRSDSGPEAEMEVRKLVLMVYRDTVILSRHDMLKSLFSRLSFESIQINTTSGPGVDVLGGSMTNNGTSLLNGHLANGSHTNGILGFGLNGGVGSGTGTRPGTANSLGPNSAAQFGSLNSQGSTLRSSSSGGDNSMSVATSSSVASRSRATSNTSAPELPPFSPTNTTGRTPEAREHVQALHSAAITETVARMLQCMSMLSSLRSDDEAQRRCEQLTTALKLNWLGRGRTGRNRKGFVGARAPTRAVRVGG